jgi:transposase InsO family protein
MVLRVGQGELTVSQAAREYGVSRNTVRLWLERSGEGTLSELAERSRRPHSIPRATDEELEFRILELKAKRPAWGAKKIVAKLWPEGPPLSVRTADRILSRHGLVATRGQVQPEVRFERDRPNELLQIDFKGLGRPSLGYSPLSVLDDATRFCLALRPLPDHQTDTIFKALWDVFGEYGLPDAILTDNEPCFAEVSRYGPSKLEAKLWLLGIRVLHGRPLHPQTQGKVERFHLTLEQELGKQLRQQDPQQAQRVYTRFVHDYNYERPHEALNMRMPGELYHASERKRPAKMPEHQPSPGALLRKVHVTGKFRFKTDYYRAGRGLWGEYIELREEADGYGVYFANRRIAALNHLRV